MWRYELQLLGQRYHHLLMLVQQLILKVFPFGYTYNGWPNVDKPTEFKPCHEANFDGDPMLARCCSTNGKIEKKVLLSHF